MALENQDLVKDPFSNFNIGSPEVFGDTKGLESFLNESDAVSTDPKDVEEIVDETVVKKQEPPKKVQKPNPPVKKKEEVKIEEEEEIPTGEDQVEDFLGKDEKPKKKVQETTEETQEEEEEVIDETNPFSSLAKDLHKLGVFTGETIPEVKDGQAFLEHFNNEKRKGASEFLDNFLGQFGDDYKDAFQAIYVNGVDPKDYFSTYNNITTVSDLDLTKEVNQEKVVRKGLEDQGFEEEDVLTELEKIKQYGDLEDKAKKFHKVLVKKEAIKLQEMEEEAKEKNEQKVAYKKQYTQNVNNILQETLKAKDFDGIPINPKLAQELQDFLVTDKYKTPSGELLTDFDRVILDLKKPENHKQKVKVALLLKTMEKDPTLSTLVRKSITKETNELFESVTRQKEKSGNKSPKESKPSSWFS